MRISDWSSDVCSSDLQAAGLGLRLETVPGSVNARPRDYEYLFPLQANEPRVQQAWGGRHSHADAENRHAVDFAADPGTVVFAARDGVVMRVRMAGPPAAGALRTAPRREREGHDVWRRVEA